MTTMIISDDDIVQYVPVENYIYSNSRHVMNWIVNYSEIFKGQFKLFNLK